MPRVLKTTIAIALLTAGMQMATAATLFLGFDATFSGIGPSGSGNWITASFTDVAGGVQLDVRADGLASPEALRSVYFNLAPAMSPAALSLTWLGGRTATISKGVNAFKADGDGRYDLLLEFGTGAGAFQPGQFSSYRLSGPVGLNANSFDFLSQPAGGHGPFIAAAHVQGTGLAGADSGWIAGDPVGGGNGGPSEVPLPAALWLLASGLLGAGAMSRRTRSMQAPYAAADAC